MRLFSLSCAAFLFLLAAPVWAKTEITVYTAAEPEQIVKYEKAFTARFPDIALKWVRDAAGPILARLAAEKDAPRADVFFGTTLTGVLSLEHLGIFAPYTPKESDQIAPAMRNADENGFWTAMNAWGSGLCVNSRELERLKLPRPESWADLTRPEYKGRIVMASPESSSTAFLAVSGWLDAMGEPAGWEYMQALDANIAMYVHSGCKPCQMAAQGEVPIGIASGMCVRPLQKRRAPVELVLPKEGVGWDMEVSGLIKNALPDDDPKRLAARAFLDFSASEEVGRLALDGGLIPAREDCMDDAVRREQAAFIKKDFAKEASGREGILQSWRERFGKR